MFICEIFGESVVLYVYIYRDVYIYICSFMCKFRQSVLSTAETTFCLCVAFLFCCTFVMDVHGFWVWENKSSMLFVAMIASVVCLRWLWHFLW